MSSDDSNFGKSSRPSKRFRLSKHRKHRTNADPEFPAEFRFSSRNGKVTNYNENASDSNDEDDDLLMVDSVIQDDGNSVDAIDQVLDHRQPRAEVVDDPYKVLEYYVKWQGQSHLHNSWLSYPSLTQYRGIKRVDNYVKQSVILDREVRQSVYTTREDVEAMDIERERHVEALESFKVVDRIISEDYVVDEETGLDIQMYYIKWKLLTYADCTWEKADLIAESSRKQIEEYRSRSESRFLPHLSAQWGSLAVRPEATTMVTQPTYIKHGELRDFQIKGLNWMAYVWSRNENGILADEMGLGKTVQTVAFLSWLVHAMHQNGPFLVVVPLSTVPAWQETLDLWAPDLNSIIYVGNAKAREIIRDFEFFINEHSQSRKPKFNVLVTTYELILKDAQYFDMFKYQFLAVDEAHRLKNDESALYEVLKGLRTTNCLFITGTPLQNNLRELSALVNFLMPNRFAITKEIDFEAPGPEQEQYIRELHADLKPFMLRRLKKDVEKSLPLKSERILRVELSDMQTHFYTNILSKNYLALNSGPHTPQLSLLNVMMELKKASNHPYLFDGAEETFYGDQPNSERTRNDILRGLVTTSGKMILIDKLLQRLKRDGHRVLIFSQMVRMLDILGDYLSLRGLPFQRLDGTVPSAVRRASIDHFNADDSPDFCFLLSTRAGGLGINLMTADTVIIFDSDWNPQADLQAMARAHRIGQKSHVMVYRFVSKDTVEEQILERARKKMLLEYAISLGLTDKAVKGKKADQLNSNELRAILKSGALSMFQITGDNQKKLEELNLDDVLEHAEDHNTTGLETSNLGSDEFNKQFEITDFKADVSWDNIIPKDQRAKIEAEEQERRNEAFLRQQIAQNSRRVAVLSGRRNIETESQNSDAAQRALKRPAKRSSLSQPVSAPDMFSESDIRHLYRSLLRYGDEEFRWDALCKDAFLEDKDQDAVRKIAEELFTESEKAVEERAQNKEEIQEKMEESSKPRSRPKATLIDFRDVKNVNCDTLLQRRSELQFVHSITAKHSEEPSSFRIEGNVKAVKDWSCDWGIFEDSMLLLGIDKHGFGAWPQIRDDPDLRMSDKMFLDEQRKEIKQIAKIKDSKDRMPAAVHLVRRSEYLINFLRDTKEQAEKDRKANGPKQTKLNFASQQKDSKRKLSPSTKSKSNPGPKSSKSPANNSPITTSKPTTGSPDESKAKRNASGSPEESPQQKCRVRGQ